jgi:DNA-binding NarL/FixJ family response regulator
LQESLAVAEELNNARLIYIALNNLGVVVESIGRYEAARDYYARSLILAKKSQGRGAITMALLNLSGVEMRLGNDRRVAELLEQTLIHHYGPTDLLGVYAVYAEMTLGELALRQGRREKARGHWQAGLAAAWESGYKLYVARGLEGMAYLAAAEGQARTAARWLAAADVQRERNGASREEFEAEDYECYSRIARRALGEAAYEAAAYAGRMQPVRDSVAEALAYAGPATAAGLAEQVAAAREAKGFGGLTAREREVAALIARGLTNDRIAAALFVAPKTAEKHVSNILDKLGFRHRTEVAAWAVARGLAPPPQDLDAQIGRQS